MTAVVYHRPPDEGLLTGFWRPRPHRGLDGLSFEIPAGGVFGLLGPNGAGKSTTLKLLLNLLRPTSGERRSVRPGRRAMSARTGGSGSCLSIRRSMTI